MIPVPKAELSPIKSRDCMGDELPCIVCGRPCDTNPIKHAFYWTQGHKYAENMILNETEAADAMHNDGGFMGLYPIGPDCLKKFPHLKEYEYKE